MERFIPYEKQSKKARRALDQARRRNWGEIDPVTRKAENKKAYKRTKPSRWYMDDSMGVLCYICANNAHSGILKARKRNPHSTDGGKRP